MSKTKKAMVQKRTLLLVGEGFDERAFLNHLKEKLIPRGAGLVVTIKNSKGKGAKHVIEWTIRQAAIAQYIAQYDVVGALFDTDTDWTPAVEKLAKQNKICLLKSEPCFEAMMLRIQGVTPELDSKKLKKQFADFVNNDATRYENYAEHFSTDILSAKSHKELTIEMLLNLLKP